VLYHYNTNFNSTNILNTNNYTTDNFDTSYNPEQDITMTHILSERTLGNARGDIRGRSRVLHHYGTNDYNTNNNQLQTDSTGWRRVIGYLILGARRRGDIRCRAPSSTLMGRQFAPSTLMAQDSIGLPHRRAPGHFPKTSPKMIGSFVERNLQLKAFYASSTPYMVGILA